MVEFEPISRHCTSLELLEIYCNFSFNGDGFGQLPGKTARTHQYAKVANYQGQPFVVGGSESGNKYRKVSTKNIIFGRIGGIRLE